eukprot:4072976-Alexandrium_andersonii.AAC.1
MTKPVCDQQHRPRPRGYLGSTVTKAFACQRDALQDTSRLVSPDAPTEARPVPGYVVVVVV